MPRSYQMLDEALDRLAGSDCALGNGNFNHAPMVAEALCALGRPEAVLPWIERYRMRLVPRAAAGEPIAADGWRDALGCRERFADWSAFFCGGAARSTVARGARIVGCTAGAGRLGGSDARRHPRRPRGARPGSGRDRTAPARAGRSASPPGRRPTPSCPVRRATTGTSGRRARRLRGSRSYRRSGGGPATSRRR